MVVSIGRCRSEGGRQVGHLGVGFLRSFLLRATFELAAGADDLRAVFSFTFVTRTPDSDASDPYEDGSVTNVPFFADRLFAVASPIGVSGDTSCTDHIVAWKIRHALNLDNVPGGVSPTGDDNIVHDIVINATGHPESASGWGHPDCGAAEKAVAAALPVTHPIGPTP